MVDTLAMALLTFLAKIRATSLKALSNPDADSLPSCMPSEQLSRAPTVCRHCAPWGHTEPWPPGAYGQGRKLTPRRHHREHIFSE